VNFFDPACQSGPYTAVSFGICDPQDSTVAYVDLDNSGDWIASVDNPQGRAITFTAIDKCVIKDHEYIGRGRCDAMLTATDLLYLVELKDQRIARKADAIEQLESTLNFLLANHDVSKYRHKKVFLCNRRKKPFAVLDNERQRNFFLAYGFRIDAQARVLIVS